MVKLDSDAWSKLESPHPAGEQLVARRVFPETTDRLYCAIDSSRIRHILIALEPGEDALQDAQSRGISVDSRDMVVQGQASNRYIDIQCRDASGYPVFDLICEEIADHMTAKPARPRDIVKRVLAKWRRFWGQLPQKLLSIEEQLGLFAELWFLSTWLVPEFGPNVIIAWRGPWGSRHDYEWPDKSVEVKATANSRGRIHRINGLDQLEQPPNGPLYMFSLMLRDEAGSPYNLPRLIETCQKQLDGAEEALSYLESGLVHVGYSPLHQEDYSKLNLGVVEEALFLVDENFPKVTRESFEGGVPHEVERVEYELNLNSLNHMIVARRGDELPFK